jgi:ABC-type microcin C transport system duplicated ATPase subunit YejF
LIVQEGALPVLIASMTSNDEELRDRVMTVLRNVTQHPENKVKFVREGGIPQLIALLRSLDPRVQVQLRPTVSLSPAGISCRCGTKSVLESSVQGALG